MKMQGCAQKFSLRGKIEEWGEVLGEGQQPHPHQLGGDGVAGVTLYSAPATFCEASLKSLLL